MDKCGPYYKECCERGRRSGIDEEVVEVGRTSPTAAASRRLLNVSSNGASNVTSSPACSKKYDIEDSKKTTGGDYFVAVKTLITTTAGKLDEVWEKLNEYDLNKKFATSCLPPVVVGYEDVSAGRSIFAKSKGSHSVFVLCSIVLSLLLSYEC